MIFNFIIYNYSIFKQITIKYFSGHCFGEIGQSANRNRRNIHRGFATKIRQTSNGFSCSGRRDRHFRVRGGWRAETGTEMVLRQWRGH